MKIITDSAAYVQVEDLHHIKVSGLRSPESVVNKIYSCGAAIINDNNRYDFIEFNERHEIEFFRKSDWIVDYNDIKNLDEDQILFLGECISREKFNISQQFNNLCSHEQVRNQDMITKCELLDYKLYSLRNIIWFKNGDIDMKLPDCVQLVDKFDSRNKKYTDHNNVVTKTLKKIFK